MNRKLVETVREMLSDFKLHKSFWAETLSIATYIRNQSPTNAVHKMTTYEVWTGHKSKKNIYVYFDAELMHLYQRIKDRKWSLKLRKASSSDMGLKLWEIDCTTLKNWVLYSRDIIFNELILIQSSEASSEKIRRCKLDKANWQIFKEKCKNRLTHIETNHDIVEHFTETLIEIAKECVPKNSTTNKRSRPWFDNKCREAIRLQRAALKRFQKQPTTPNLIEY